MDTFTYSSTGTTAFLDAFASLSVQEMEILLPKLTRLRDDAWRKGEAGPNSKHHRKPRNRPRKQRSIEKKELSLAERLDLPLQAPQEPDLACNGDCIPYSRRPPEERLTKAQLDREMDDYRRKRIPSVQVSEALKKQFL